MVDYVLYCDTDSHFCNVDLIMKENGLTEKWNLIPDDEKVEIIIKISKEVQDVVNDRIYNETQIESYNSVEKEFKITYKAEKISKSNLFVKKKKYAVLTLWNEGVYGEKIVVKGLEIVRSDTPTFFRTSLKTVLSMILKRVSDEELKKVVRDFEDKAYNLPFEEISGNIGINGIKTYIRSDFKSRKGAPSQLKGVANYMFLMNKLKLNNKYPSINEGEKVKVIYLKDNVFGLGVLSYIVWPKEIEELGILPDKKKMIDKFFTKKVNYLLTPANKQDILNNNDSFNVFFNKEK